MPNDKQSTTSQGRRSKRKAAPLGNLMSNPAFAGAEDVVDYSVFASPTPSMPSQSDAQKAASSSEVPHGEPATSDARPSSAPSPRQPTDSATTVDSAPAKDNEPDAVSEPTQPAAPEMANHPAPAATAHPRAEGRRERSKGPTAPEPTDAHKAVAHSWTESTLDLMLGTKDWAAVPVRLTSGMAESLTNRMVLDSEATGKRMTQAHYVDAAFRRHLPSTLDAQVKLAESYLRSGRAGTTGKQSTYRLGPDVAGLVKSLPMGMKKAGRSRTAVHVYSAAVQRLLDELEADGPLIWPEEPSDQKS